VLGTSVVLSHLQIVAQVFFLVEGDPDIFTEPLQLFYKDREQRVPKSSPSSPMLNHLWPRRRNAIKVKQTNDLQGQLSEYTNVWDPLEVLF
jgi:hypothetical protein